MNTKLGLLVVFCETLPNRCETLKTLRKVVQSMETLPSLCTRRSARFSNIRGHFRNIGKFVTKNPKFVYIFQPSNVYTKLGFFVDFCFRGFYHSKKLNSGGITVYLDTVLNSDNLVFRIGAKFNNRSLSKSVFGSVASLEPPSPPTKLPQRKSFDNFCFCFSSTLE